MQVFLQKHSSVHSLLCNYHFPNMTTTCQHHFNDALNRVLLNLGERETPEQIQEIVLQCIDTESVLPVSHGTVPFQSCIDHYENACSECQVARKTGGKISVACHLKNIIGGSPGNDKCEAHLITRAHDVLQLVEVFGQTRIIRLFKGLLIVRQPEAIKVVREIEDTTPRSDVWSDFIVNDGFDAMNKMGEYINGKLRVVALSHKHRARVNRPGPFAAGVGEKTELVQNRRNADDSVDAVWLDVVFSRCQRHKWGPECILPYVFRSYVSYWLVTAGGPSATATVFFAPNLQALRTVFELKVENVRWHGSVLTGHVVRCQPKIEDVNLVRGVSGVLQMIASSKGVSQEHLYFMEERLAVGIEGKQYFLIPERLSRVNGHWDADTVMCLKHD